jgi:virginiamycin B lyase
MIARFKAFGQFPFRKEEKNMKKAILFLVTALVLVLSGVAGGSKGFSLPAQSGPRIRGTVKSADGKTLEGVTVSIQAPDSTMITTVFTNEKGVYVFPPLAKAAKYSLWAQAQGFQTAEVEVNGQAQEVAALQMKPLKDIEKQMTGVEWMNSFPDDTPAEKREKKIVMSTCTGCHSLHFALQNRFDADGWNKIVTVMSKDSEGVQMRAGAVGSPQMNAYQSEIVAFLTKVRGPAPANYTLKPLPRPTGEAAQVVITEYLMPRPEAPEESLVHNGSDWMEGTPSRWEGRATHDLAIGADGNVYASDDRSMNRSITQLDPRTGKAQFFVIPGTGGAWSTHGVTTDLDGNIWTATFPGPVTNFLKFDVKTLKFTDFPHAPGTPNVGGTFEVDKKAYKNMVWAESGDGAIKLDPTTGTYTYFAPVTPGKGTYGITVDRLGNAWFTSPGGDKVGVVDAETGKVSEVSFPPIGPESGMEVTDKDRQTYVTEKNNQNSENPLMNCPRRDGADHNGDVVWVALFCANKIAKIDIRTHAVTEYALPHNYSSPYGLVVDNDHNVWINVMNADMLVKFNPTTEKFTEYQLPSRGTDVRHFTFDYNTNPMEVYVAYNRSNKIARIQFRKPSDMQ